MSSWYIGENIIYSFTYSLYTILLNLMSECCETTFSLTTSPAPPHDNRKHQKIQPLKITKSKDVWMEGSRNDYNVFILKFID